MLANEHRADSLRMAARKSATPERRAEASGPGGSLSEARDELARARFRHLVEDLGAEQANARGWKRRLARQLKITPEHLSRLMTEARAPSLDLLDRAAQVFGFDRAYFFDVERLPRATYRDYLVFELLPGAPTRAAENARAAAGRVLARLASPSGPAVVPSDAHALAEHVLALPIVSLAERVHRMRPDDPELHSAAITLAIEVSQTVAGSRRPSKPGSDG